MRKGAEVNMSAQPQFAEGDHERFGVVEQTGRALNPRLRALNLNLEVMGSQAGTCEVVAFRPALLTRS